jgi:hypothetical protein
MKIIADNEDPDRTAREIQALKSRRLRQRARQRPHRGPGTPLHATVLAEDHDRFIVTGTPGPSTSRLVRLDLDVPAPQRTTESWRSADDVSNTILPLWVWVGYYTTAALLAVDSVEAVSVYEVKVT